MGRKKVVFEPSDTSRYKTKRALEIKIRDSKTDRYKTKPVSFAKRKKEVEIPLRIDHKTVLYVRESSLKKKPKYLAYFDNSIEKMEKYIKDCKNNLEKVKILI